MSCFTDTPKRADPRNEAMKRTRRHRVEALASCKGDKTLAELAEHFGVPPTQITEWERHVLKRVADLFGGTTHMPDSPDLKILHAKVQPLTLENDFFRRSAHHMRDR